MAEEEEIADQETIIIEKIFDSLVLATGFTDEDKYDLAYAICENIYQDFTNAQEIKNLFNELPELIGYSEDAREKIVYFLNKLIESKQRNNHHWSFNPILNSQIAGSKSLNNALGYLEGLESNLNKVKNSLRKTGRENIISLDLAKMVAEEYFRHFRECPSTGKSRDNTSKKAPLNARRVTHFDNVCNIVEKYFGVNINVPSRQKAIDNIKKKTGTFRRKKLPK